MNIAKKIAVLGLAFASATLADKYEAESATLTGGAENVNSAGVSGSGYANLNSGTITFEKVTTEAAGKYQVTFHYKAGDFKSNNLKVNGTAAATVDFNATTGWGDVSAVVNLKAGANTISLEAYWGWVSVDYIDVSLYQSPAFQLSAMPVTPNATDGAVKLYSFLRENFGKKTISGIMTGDMGSYAKDADFKTHDDVKDIYQRSGKYPALVGLDFLFASGPNAGGSWNVEYTEKAVSLAKNLWKNGGIPAFTWHWKDPLDKSDAFYIKSAAGDGEYTDFDFKTAFKSGTTEWDTQSAAYKGIIADVDHIADYFLELQEAGVAAIFRPLHEAGGLWFWWSINSGKEFVALYRLVFDRMVKDKGVRNLVWVYNPITKAVTDWDPGADYYDVIAVDIYNNGFDYSSNSGDFEMFKKASAAKKMIALSENGPIPDVNNMHADEAVWSWWMPWYGTWGGKWPAQTDNSVWKSNMDDARVITIEDMPGWEKYAPGVSDDTVSQAPGTTRIANTLRLGGTAVTTGIFDMNGHYVGLSLQGLPQGRYIVRKNVQGRMVNKLYIKK